MKHIRNRVVDCGISYTVISQCSDDFLINVVLQMRNFIPAVKDIVFIHLEVRIIQIHERMPHEKIDEEVTQLKRMDLLITVLFIKLERHHILTAIFLLETSLHDRIDLVNQRTIIFVAPHIVVDEIDWTQERLQFFNVMNFRDNAVATHKFTSVLSMISHGLCVCNLTHSFLINTYYIL